MAQPGGRLFDFALDALGKYVYDLCSKLTEIPRTELATNKHKKRKSTCTANIEKVKIVCNKLQEMLRGVPISIANELTNKLLDSVDNWEYEVGKCRKGSTEEQIYMEIVTSVIHPAVSKIEPGQDLFNCSEIFSETVFCSFLCLSLIIRNAYNLKNLRNLHILHSNMNFNFTQIEFPENLVEFSGRCKDEVLIKILKSCKNLRYLNVFGSRGITDMSIYYLLQLDHLEKLNITETRITSRGIKKLMNGLFEKFGKLIPLKYFAFSCNGPHHFKCLEMLSDMKISLQVNPNLVGLDVSRLYKFRNIVELQITSTLHKINKLLKEIGNQLVYLDVEIEHFGPVNNDDDEDEEEEENWDIEEILKVGQYCSSLKCLHILISYYFFPRMPDFIRQPLPGYQTVRCLTLDIEDERYI
ncbi:hypothetical protein L9F63_022569 [Diploptera punctata]|uniref:Uncharacterized protein n=1 Tax=Diploptera punctata TaxID=6984 RepID=A0AAD7ZMF6_DIPPU|nr:hypothetical protein L9F63_022569 [Diploptera punctata]